MGNFAAAAGPVVAAFGKGSNSDGDNFCSPPSSPQLAFALAPLAASCGTGAGSDDDDGGGRASFWLAFTAALATASSVQRDEKYVRRAAALLSVFSKSALGRRASQEAGGSLNCSSWWRKGLCQL